MRWRGRNARHRLVAAGNEVDLNGGHWTPDPPDTDETVTAMIAVTARDVDEASFADWLRERVQFEDTAA
jgi:hypothetical protein